MKNKYMFVLISYMAELLAVIQFTSCPNHTASSIIQQRRAGAKKCEIF